MSCISSPKTVAMWRRHVARQHAGNLTAAAYCRKSKIPVTAFRWWRSRLLREVLPKSGLGFVRLPPSVGTIEPAGVTIHLPGNIRLCAYPQTERRLLADAVRLLRAQP